MKLAQPLRIGWESVRANAVPMVTLQCMAVGLVAAYYLVPSFRALLEPVADWHRENGCLSAFLSQAFFCGILPGAFQLVMASIRPRKPWLTILAQALWCGLFGVGVNELFRAFATYIGNDAAFSTLLLKTALDQFVWTAFLIVPANSVFFFWVGRDFSASRVRREWPEKFVGWVYLPNLIANWCVWIPVCMAVFAFPLSLQLYANGLACAFWTLMCVQLGKRVG